MCYKNFVNGLVNGNNESKVPYLKFSELKLIIYVLNVFENMFF